MDHYHIGTNEYGKITVSERVIQEVILEEVVQVVGVHSQEKTLLGAILKPFSQKVRIEQTNGSLEVTVPIKVFHGTNVIAVAHSVQDRIGFSLKQMLGFDNVTVNINVEGLILQH